MVKMGDIADDQEHASVSLSGRTSRVKLSKRLKARNTQILIHPPCNVQCNCKPEASGFLSSTSREEGNTNNNGMICSSIPSHAVFVFLDPLLLGVIQVEFQNKPKSPIEAHPVNMWLFIIAICFYSTVLGVKKSSLRLSLSGNNNYDSVFNSILLVFGSLSSASLLSILLPYLLVWFLIIIWASLPLILASHLLKLLFHWIWGWIVNLASKVRNFNMFSGINRPKDQENLPK